MEMVFRSRYYFGQAAHRHKATDIVAYREHIESSYNRRGAAYCTRWARQAAPVAKCMMFKCVLYYLNTNAKRVGIRKRKFTRTYLAKLDLASASSS